MLTSISCFVLDNFQVIFEESPGRELTVNKLDDFCSLNLQVTTSLVCEAAAYFYSNFQKTWF